MQSNGFYALTLVGKKREYAQTYIHFEARNASCVCPGPVRVHLLAPSSPPGRGNIRPFHPSVPEEGPLTFTVDLASATDYKKLRGLGRWR